MPDRLIHAFDDGGAQAPKILATQHIVTNFLRDGTIVRDDNADARSDVPDDELLSQMTNTKL